MRHGNGACRPGGCGVPLGKLVLLRQITASAEDPRVLKSARSSLCRALVPAVLPAVMPADLPAEGRAALAAALQGSLPAAKAPGRGELVREAVPCRWDDAEAARLRGFLATAGGPRGAHGRVYPRGGLLPPPPAPGRGRGGERGAHAGGGGGAPGAHPRRPRRAPQPA